MEGAHGRHGRQDRRVAALMATGKCFASQCVWAACMAQLADSRFRGARKARRGYLAQREDTSSRVIKALLLASLDAQRCYS